MATYCDFGCNASGYQTVWVEWCAQDSGTSTATTTCAYDAVWPTWVSETQTTYAASGTSTAWYQWNKEDFEDHAKDEYNYKVRSTWVVAKETREAKKRREEEAKKILAWKKKKEAAEKVALELLEEFIGHKERLIYEETGRLLVRGKKADYILSKENGVSRVEKDKVVDLCIHLRDRHSYPETDNVIALALKVKDDEEGFNEMANEYDAEPRPCALPRCANGFD